MVQGKETVVRTIKTLIFGVGGMLGTDMRANFTNAISYTNAELDITDKNEVFSIIDRLRPELVINAAAYTKVDDCEENIELAFSVNGTAPGYMAEACERIGSKLVHFSMDYVFNGKKMNIYNQINLIPSTSMVLRNSKVNEQ